MLTELAVISEESNSPWYFVFDHRMFISSSFSTSDFLYIHLWKWRRGNVMWKFWGRAEEGKRETLLYENIWGRAEVKSNGNINKLQFDGTIHYQWVPRSHSIYQYAIENWAWTFENSHFLFPVSIILTQNFLVLSDGNITQKPSQTRFFWWEPRVLDHKLWKLSDITQFCGFPNKL